MSTEQTPLQPPGRGFRRLDISGFLPEVSERRLGHRRGRLAEREQVAVPTAQLDRDASSGSAEQLLERDL